MVTFSNEMIAQMQLTESEFRTELALWLFSSRKISIGFARKLAGLDVWAFQQLLDERGIHVHYDVEEYLGDLRHLQILPA